MDLDDIAGFLEESAAVDTRLDIPAAVKEVAALQVRQAVARIRELGPPF